MTKSQYTATSMVLSKLIFKLKKIYEILLVKHWNLFGWTPNILKFLIVVYYVLLARLDPAQSWIKVTKNLLFSSKMAENKLFLMKKANSS